MCVRIIGKNIFPTAIKKDSVLKELINSEIMPLWYFITLYVQFEYKKVPLLQSLVQFNEQRKHHFKNFILVATNWLSNMR